MIRCGLRARLLKFTLNKIGCINMNPSSYSASSAPDGLILAITQATEEDSVLNPLAPAQWEIASAYLQPMNLGPSQILFSKDAPERTLSFVESGSLSVHFEDSKQRLRIAIVKPGSVVGEGAFFSHRPRSATVQANEASKVWTLTALRFTELANRQPAIALALSMAAGAVMAKRLGSSRRRAAIP